MVKPSAHELWQQAGGGTPLYDKATYQRLLREHGLLLPGPPEPLPCGWPTTRRRHDPGALMEEPDLYEQGGGCRNTWHTDHAMPAGPCPTCGQTDAEQGEGDDRG